MLGGELRGGRVERVRFRLGLGFFMGKGFCLRVIFGGRIRFVVVREVYFRG